MNYEDVVTFTIEQGCNCIGRFDNLADLYRYYANIRDFTELGEYRFFACEENKRLKTKNEGKLSCSKGTCVFTFI